MSDLLLASELEKREKSSDFLPCFSFINSLVMFMDKLQLKFINFLDEQRYFRHFCRDKLLKSTVLNCVCNSYTRNHIEFR